MSVRANLLIIQNDCSPIWLFHHNDGNPQCMGQKLLTMLKDNSFLDAYHFGNFLLKNQDDKGFELTDDIHTDIEYLYTLNEDYRTFTAEIVKYIWPQEAWKRNEIFVCDLTDEKDIGKWISYCINGGEIKFDDDGGNC
jgi:hypothetical protein